MNEAREMKEESVKETEEKLPASRTPKEELKTG